MGVKMNKKEVIEFIDDTIIELKHTRADRLNKPQLIMTLTQIKSKVNNANWGALVSERHGTWETIDGLTRCSYCKSEHKSNNPTLIDKTPFCPICGTMMGDYN